MSLRGPVVPRLAMLVIPHSHRGLGFTSSRVPDSEPWYAMGPGVRPFALGPVIRLGNKWVERGGLKIESIARACATRVCAPLSDILGCLLTGHIVASAMFARPANQACAAVNLPAEWSPAKYSYHIYSPSMYNNLPTCTECSALYPGNP